MGSVRRSSAAREDLIQAWTDIAQGNPAAADRFLDRVDALCNLLAAFPNMGGSADDVRPGLRCLTVRRYPYLVFYEIDGDDVVLVRVLHGARDVPSVFDG